MEKVIKQISFGHTFQSQRKPFPLFRDSSWINGNRVEGSVVSHCRARILLAAKEGSANARKFKHIYIWTIT